MVEHRCKKCGRVFAFPSDLKRHEARITDCATDKYKIKSVEENVLLYDNDIPEGVGQEIQAREGETILCYCLSGDRNYVALTTERFIKVENGKSNEVKLSELASVRVQKNGIFHWNKVETCDKNGTIKTFGIRVAENVEYFVNRLSKHCV